VPVDREPERVLHLDDAGTSEAAGGAPIAPGIRRDAVDVVG
jgi:hypothetical protein